MEAVGLCHRCEHRALFYETGMRPRYECGSGDAVTGCYMYNPVKPMIVKKREKDPRPVTMNILSARVEAVRVGEVILDSIILNGEIMFYWMPNNGHKTPKRGKREI